MDLVAGHVGQVPGFVMNGQYLARQHLDLANAHYVKGRVGNPWNHAQCLDFLCGVARQGAVSGRHVVNRNDWQLVFVTALAQLHQYPVAVSRRYLAVLVFASIPALEQRFGRHCIRQSINLRQNFKAPVENQLGIGVGAFDVLDETGHARNLLKLGLGCFGHQVKRVQCVQKKRTITLVPQWLDDLRQIKRRPAGRGLVDHDGTPGGIFAKLPFGSHGFEIAPRGVNFTHRNVGGYRGARVESVAPAPDARVVAGAIAHIARFNHRHIKRAECLPRNVFAVVESKRRCRKRGLCASRCKQQGNDSSNAAECETQ